MTTLSEVVGMVEKLSFVDRQKLFALLQVDFCPPLQGVSRPQSVGGKPPSSTGKPETRKTSKKGNPSRKSQYATNPLYKEYARLKKLVRLEAKDLKTPFSELKTPLSEEYRVALTHWVKAKSAFRGRVTTESTQEVKDSSEMEMESGSPLPASGHPDGSSFPKRRRVSSPPSVAKPTTGERNKISFAETVKQFPVERSKPSTRSVQLPSGSPKEFAGDSK